MNFDKEAKSWKKFFFAGGGGGGVGFGIKFQAPSLCIFIFFKYFFIITIIP